MKYLKTYIKKIEWTENGEYKVKYEALASGINRQGIFFRHPVGRLITDMDNSFYHMSSDDLDALLGHHPKGSKERQMAIINLYRKTVDQWNANAAIEKEAKRKTITIIKYPE